MRTVMMLCVAVVMLLGVPFAAGDEVAAKEAASQQSPPNKPTSNIKQPTPSPNTDTPEPKPKRTVYRPSPGFNPELRAPKPGRRPAPAPFATKGERTVTQGLTEGFSLTNDRGFSEPDWTQPLRDVKADRWELSSDEYLFQGNVKLHLDTLDFSADEFCYNEVTGEMRATGNVVITQGNSQMKADQVEYRVPEASQLPGPALISINADEQGLAKRRLSSGLLKAQNVTIAEPTQGLTARTLEYDLARSTGMLSGAAGQTGIYFFNAEQLKLLGPGDVDGQGFAVTTCDHDPPHYSICFDRIRIRDNKAAFAKGAQLELGKLDTPFYWPRWGYESGKSGSPLNLSFDSGHRAKVGYYMDLTQSFRLNDDMDLGVRVYPTTRKGVGVGLSTEYDFTKTPSSPLFMGKGSIESLYTTHDEGYIEMRHRHTLTENAVLLGRLEQWSDREFYKDFFYDEYKNRTAPRTFLNVTRTGDTTITTATIRTSINGFVNETERLPEVTHHILERPLTDNLYFSFDTINGLNVRQPDHRTEAARSVNIARLTYDLDLNEALSITPFLKAETTWYSETYNSDDSEGRFSATLGATVQTRLHREYPGAAGFSGFKHIVVPSLTYTYTPEPSMSVYETPRFDAYDLVRGRSRIESKLDNIVLGRDSETEEVWQVARLSLYQGTDLWNEVRKSQDYEAELDLRPRPWWGWMLAAEQHNTDETFLFNDVDSLENGWARFWNDVSRRLSNEDDMNDLSRFGSYKRFLTYLYYDDVAQGGKFDARLGFAYTNTMDTTFNREVLYGLGYKLGNYWGVAFEHRYDFERDELMQQEYEIRRVLHCWEAALTFRDRQQGWDVGISFNIAAFPGTKVKF